MSSAPFNVLVITDKFSPHAGGTAVCWTEWVRRWPAEQVCVITRRFTRSDDSVPRPYAIRRVPFVDIPKLRMPLLWLGLFLYTLWEVIARRRPAVIHCAQVLETGWIGLFCKRLWGIPYVIHMYGEEIRIHASRTVTARLQNQILKEASAVTSNTRFTRDLVHAHTTYQGPIAVTYPGVDVHTFHPPATTARPGPITLLTVGRLMKRKGHEMVFTLLPDLLREFPDLQYLIVGVGPHQAALQARVRERNLQHCVHLLGRLDDGEVVRLLRESHLFVHPNRELPDGDVEGFGMVFPEASGCGLPVIGGRSGGTPEAICHGQTGFLVDPDSAEDVKTHILLLLRDRERWNQMSQAGPAWAAQFSWERSAHPLWELTCRVAELSLHRAQ